VKERIPAAFEPNFVDPRLHWRATDLLFRVRIDGRDATPCPYV